MASLDDLRDALESMLEANGTMEQLKARVRADVFHAIECQDVPHPTPTHDTMLINELIREYLAFNNYKHTQSVFYAESGQSQGHSLGKDVVNRELGTVELSKPCATAAASSATPAGGGVPNPGVPLLYALVGHLKSRRQQADIAGVRCAADGGASSQSSTTGAGAGGGRLSAAAPPSRLAAARGRYYLSLSGVSAASSPSAAAPSGDDSLHHRHLSHASAGGSPLSSTRSTTPTPTPTPPPPTLRPASAAERDASPRTAQRARGSHTRRPRGAPRRVDDSALSLASSWGADSVPSTPQALELHVDTPRA